MTEHLTTVGRWVVIYPATCNGALRDLGFVYPLNGNSDFVHFDKDGLPYGTPMPKKVAARLVTMRKRHKAELDEHQAKLRELTGCW